ncbi:hypothetical protein [Methylorubrum aminovorans]|uniref:hypothetical protein n=1 Tax=Methylorubrum aminovorans TaxID=269069 RepID=UPI001EDE9620|nr:hypothetical protein [Methylorubrum aminovorans]
MTKTIHRLPPRHSVVRLTACGLLLSFSTTASAQQSSGQPVPTEVAVEYATIGSVSLPIRILGLNGGTGGQVATNLQVGNANRTDISQTGRGNAAAIQIFGDGNSAAIAQRGSNNVGQGLLVGSSVRFDLQQTGIGNQADLSVNAPGGANLQLRQDGNGNSLTGSVPGAANVVVNQVGNGLSADVTQVGVPKNISVQQVRAR